MPDQIKPPNPEIVTSVVNLLEEHHVIIPYDHIDIVVATFSHWLETTRRGREYMAYLMQLDSAPGKHEKKYLERDVFGRLTNEIKPDSIIFLRGCIVDGKSYPIGQLEIKDRERELCESCGCLTVCAQEKETSYGKKNLCSHCSSSDDDSRLRDSVGLKCEDCTHATCSWHPVNVDAPPFERYGDIL